MKPSLTWRAWLARVVLIGLGIGLVVLFVLAWESTPESEQVELLAFLTAGLESIGLLAAVFAVGLFIVWCMENVGERKSK